MRKFLTLLFIVSVLGASQARADSVTNRLGLTLPTVGGDYYTWGTILNNDLTLIDALVGALQQSNVFTTTATFNGPVYFGSVGQSTITAAGIFQGNGSGLTNIPGSSLLSGSTFYIQNTNALQAGSTAYPQFLYVGSSGTVLGSGLAINGLAYAWPSTVPGGTSALQNNGSNVLSWASGSGTNILNQNTLQAGSTAYPQFLYVGSSETITGASTANSYNGSGAGLTGVIFNQNSLQANTTAYPQFLYVGSTATIPTISLTTENYSNGAPAFNGSNGRILQNVYCKVSASSATSAGAGVFDKSNIGCTITPKLSTSIIRVSAGIQADESNGSDGKALCEFQIVRSSSTVISANFGDACGGGGSSAAATNTFCTTPLFVPDSPGSTSATVYGIYFSGEGSGGGCVVNSNSNRQATSWMNLDELGQ